MYPEQVLVVVALLFLLAWLELKMRIAARYLAQTTVRGVGVLIFIIGAILLIASAFGYVEQKIGIYVAVAGFVIYIIGWVLRLLKKGEGLEIEEEKREYLKRVRKGMTAEDAEKTAYNYLRRETNDTIKKIASTKEFKTWKVFFKGNKNKYQVIVDMDGDVVDWETLEELPSWLKGPY